LNCNDIKSQRRSPTVSTIYGRRPAVWFGSGITMNMSFVMSNR